MDLIKKTYRKTRKNCEKQAEKLEAHMIHIYGDFYLDADERCYIVGTLSKDPGSNRNGELKEAKRLLNMTYHPSIPMAVQHVIQKRLRDSVRNGELLTLQAVAKRCQQLNEELKEVLKVLKVEGEKIGWPTTK
jgi:uncharacterized membrane protein